MGPVLGFELGVSSRPGCKVVNVSGKLERWQAEQSAELQLPEDLSLVEIPVTREEETSVSPPESPLDAQRVINWHEAITETVAEFVSEDVRQEESRAHMWRQNYSLMFQPADTGSSRRGPHSGDNAFRLRERLNLGCFRQLG